MDTSGPNKGRLSRPQSELIKLLAQIVVASIPEDQEINPPKETHETQLDINNRTAQG